MDPHGGNAAGGGHLPAAGEHLPAPARSPDGGARVQDGALCRRLRDLVSDGGGGEGGAAPSRGVDGGERPDAASGQDADRRRRQPGAGFRLPRLSVRGGPPIRAQKEPEGDQGQGARQDETNAGATAWSGSSTTSIRCSAAGSSTSNTPSRRSFGSWTASSEDGCAPSCASRKSGPASDSAPKTIDAGQTPTSPTSGCSRSKRPDIKRDVPDEETNDWRAVCGRTARTVRREGRRKPSLPLSRGSAATKPARHDTELILIPGSSRDQDEVRRGGFGVGNA